MNGSQLNTYLEELLSSKEKFNCKMFSSLKCVSSDYVTLKHLTEKFGVCIPAVPTYLVKHAFRLEKRECDPVIANLLAFDPPFIAFSSKHKEGRLFLEAVLNVDEESLPIKFAKASWKVGFHPYPLPPQWHVTPPFINCGGELFIDEIYPEVKEYYKNYESIDAFSPC